MSAGAEGNEGANAEQSRIIVVPPPVSAGTVRQRHPHHHHVLIEPDEDRWRWRRKIRQNPRQLAVYRIGVAIAGLLLVCLGFISGPIPGPGGIPLVLLGLAIWSSEFEWAYKLMQSFKGLLHRYQAWSLRSKVLFWFGFVAVCGMLGYGYLLLTGVPRWLPGPIQMALVRLPGL
jgi:uncharacterized protein (TIGR02611 family)